MLVFLFHFQCAQYNFDQTPSGVVEVVGGGVNDLLVGSELAGRCGPPETALII